jgi:hypothetical protein
MDPLLKNIYDALQDITSKDLHIYDEVDVNATSYFCKRIISLSRVLKERKIKIKLSKKIKLVDALILYQMKNKYRLYIIPKIGIFQMSCSYEILLDCILEIETY